MASDHKRIALFGATGTAGHAAARMIRDAGHEVIALGREDPKVAGIESIQLNLNDSTALSDTLRGLAADAIVSCLASRTGVPQDAWAVDHAANLRILNAAQGASVPQFVLLSALCVQKPRLAFQHAKLAFEAALVRSGMAYAIVRPTAFFKSLSGQIDRLRRGKPYLMFGDGALTACKPISDEDLGRFIAHCLVDPAKHNCILPIGGPGSALTPREMGTALFEALGLPPKYTQVSPQVIKTIAAGLTVAGTMSPKLRAKAELARIGHYYATESMLVWDPVAERYDADATPSFGKEHLFDHYRALVAGDIDDARGAHAVF